MMSQIARVGGVSQLWVQQSLNVQLRLWQC